MNTALYLDNTWHAIAELEEVYEDIKDLPVEEQRTLLAALSVKQRRAGVVVDQRDDHDTPPEHVRRSQSRPEAPVRRPRRRRDAESGSIRLRNAVRVPQQKGHGQATTTVRHHHHTRPAVEAVK